MFELSHADSVQGRVIVTFDGHVLEKFSERTTTSERMIAGMLHVDVDGPDRKGRRQVWFTCQPNRRGGGFTLWVAEDQWAGVEPFVLGVTAALV
jgi:hypothetical protein